MIRRHAITTAVGLTLALLAWGTATARDPVADRPGFTNVPLAEGVHLLRPRDDGGAFTNSIVVERTDGLLVIEAQPSPEAATLLLREIRRFSDAPVRYLVLSHAHAEVAGGREAFPAETRVIASVGYAEIVKDEYHDFDRELTRRPGASPEQTVSAPAADLWVGSELTLDDARNPVLVRVMSRAHAPGDLTVELSRHGVSYVGDLLAVDRIPFAGDADISAWNSTLNYLAAIPEDDRLIPLHGPPRGRAQARQNRDALAWLRATVGDAFIERVPKDRMADRVLESPRLAHFFPQDDPWGTLSTLIERIVIEVEDSRRKRGFE